MSNSVNAGKHRQSLRIGAWIALVAGIGACSSSTAPQPAANRPGGTGAAGGSAQTTQGAGTGGVTAGTPPVGSGGAGPATGGTPTGTGAAQNGTGGTPIVGGAPSASGGSMNTGGTANAGSGGPNTSGAPNAAGGAPNSAGGAPNPSGGAPNPSGGAPGAAGGGTTLAGASGMAGNTAILRSSTADPTYATAGSWHGYIWPAIESGAAVTPGSVTTISPTAAMGFRGGGPPFCVAGHVPATTNSTSVAMIGMNTNQERSGGAVAAQWTATGTGIRVNVSNPGASPLRLQIQTNETGAIATLWCAMITDFDQNVVVPWSEFNTRCWNDSGTAYDQSAGIATVMVLVPGTAQAGGYDFDFCINDLAPI